MNDMHGPPPGSGYRALVVDDAVPLAEVMAAYLEGEMFDVSLAHSEADALVMAREIDPDVVVLDLALPGIDGLEVCRQLRTFSNAFVVMLTARDTEIDTVVRLGRRRRLRHQAVQSTRTGCPQRAMPRRPRIVVPSATATTEAAAVGPPPRVFGPMSIDVAGRQVFVDGEAVMLTAPNSTSAALSFRPKMAFSRRQLLEAAGGESGVGNEHLGDDPAEPRS